MNKRFIKVTKTKWDTIKNKSQYNNSIVFIDGESVSPNQIYTNGKIYANDAQGGGGGGQGVTYTAGANINIDSANAISATGYEVTTNNSFVEGSSANQTEVTATLGHIEGEGHSASGNYIHAEGLYNELIGADNSHAEGSYNVISSADSHVEGTSNKVIGSNSHAEGNSNIVNQAYSHVEGTSNQIDGYCSHAEGYGNSTLGYYSHVIGVSNFATDYSELTLGQYNKYDNTYQYSTYFAPEASAIIVGNGVSDKKRSNAFKLLYNGNAYTGGKGRWNAGGADYAEMFEWTDGNPNEEDRVGYFVNLTGNKIDKANSKSKNIIGVISATAAILGDNPMEWHNIYETDEWGRIKYVAVNTDYVEPMKDNPKNKITKTVKTRIDIVPKFNDKYDQTKDYISREDRPEWGTVGLLGKLLVRQDGSLKVGDYCTANDEGVATKATKGYYVMEVISDTQVKILFK